ncbi:PAS domain S-box protein [Patescibacteria group bacterium]|nr:PAS domain S-box protein [Patescibacteria group bacterium]MBU1682310.1 PAS domain S-box protein [Patescibacteria group bacterium]MBU1935042.1 PAS domain S-box protein [Patescibacteria group bacterium]
MPKTKKEDIKYQDIVKHANIGILIAQDGLIKFTNKTVEKITGYSKKEWFNKPFTNFIYPEDRKLVIEHYTRKLQGKEKTSMYSFRIIDKKGRIKWFEIHSVRFDWDGKPASLNFLSDITKRKQTEIELLQEKNKIQKYLDIANTILIAINQDGEVTMLNKKGCRLLGYKQNEIIGKNWFDICIPKEIRNKLKKYSKLLLNGKIKPIEYHENVILCKNGQQKLIGWYNTLLKDDKGNIIGHLSSGEDITERKKTEEQLLFLSSVAEQVSDSIVVTDVNFEITYINKAAEKLFGYTLQELKGQTPSLFNAESLSEQLQNKLYKSIKKGKQFATTWTNKRKDGSTFICDFRVSPLKNNQGKIIGYIGIQRDVTEHKKIQEDLKESEEKFRTLTEKASDILYSMNAKGVLQYIGPQVKRYGFSPDKMVGKSFLKFVLPEDRKKVNLDYQKTFKTGEEFPTEFRIKDAKGNIQWLEEYGSLQKDKNGKITGVTGVLRGITERKKAEEALQKAHDELEIRVEERTAELKEANEQLLKIQLGIKRSKEAVFITNVKGIITYVNPAFERIYGYKSEEIVGKKTPRILKSNTLTQTYYNNLWKKLMNKQSTETEMFNKTKDGQLINIRQSANPIVDQKGNILGFLAIQNNVTEQKRAEKEIKEMSERLKLATQAAQIGVWDWDVKNNVLIWDESMYKLYGINTKDFSGAYEAWTKTLHPSDAEKASKEVQLALSGKKEFNTEFRITRLDGMVRTISGRATVYRDNKGKPTRMIGVNADITERKEIDKAKSEFVSLASHQLRTPLTSIKWLVEAVLQKGSLDKLQKEYLQDALGSNERMIKLVNDLLNISRLEAGVINVTPKKTDISEFVNELIKESRFMAKENNQTIKFTKPKKKIIAHMDRQLIGQVISNLISNALKYSKKNTTVTVLLKKQTDKITISITDKGIGISKEDQGKLFTRFFRSIEATQISTTGSGLGLYIIKKILNICNGSIKCKSAPAKGSTFTVTLPIKGVGRRGLKELIQHTIS